MDAFYIDPSDQDSRQCRSRANSHLSSTAAQLQGLNIGVSAPSSEPRGNLSDPHHTSSDTHPASSSTSPDHERHPSPISFISAPVPQQTIPFPLLSESDFDANWSYHLSEEGQTGTAPLLRLDPARPFLGSHPDQTSSHHDNLTAATMSTVGIQQFDPRFDAGIPGIRHTYTWPQFDMNQEFLSQNPSPGLGQDSLTPFDDPKLLPLYARSLSSSPPRGSLTPEQRELKRQRDHARRDSKTRIRRERSTSNPYVVSQKGSPDMLPRTVPEYTTSLTPSPLLSQESPSLGSTAYLTPYSPQIGTDSVPSDMYGPVFTMAPNDFTTIPAYNIPYSNAGEPSLQSFVTRPHSLSSASDHQPNIYQTQQVSPKMVASDSGDHVRVVHSRPKPQCWEHGCNGRQFSTFSNLLRHQREKSGAAAKSTCPNCGAEFTRTTARNGHMAHEKCKQRRNS